MKIQYHFPGGSGTPERAQAVTDAFRRVYGEYEKYCFGKDGLQPIAKTCDDGSLWGFGGTIIDGLDTAIAMNLTDIVAKGLENTAKVDFSKATVLVELFDANIRIIAGLLSAYDLLKSGMFYNDYPEDQIDALLTGAKTLATSLKPCFDTPSGIPASFTNFTSQQPVDGPRYTSPDQAPFDGKSHRAQNTAVAGTLILEYFRLSDLTGDDSFATLARKAESHLINPKPAPKFPGLVGGQVSTDTGEFLDFNFGWQSGVDSFFEYLIKMHVYDPEQDRNSEYLDFWTLAVESSMKHDIVSPYGFANLKFLSNTDTIGNLKYSIDDYTCFAGGNFLLGGAYLGRQDIKDAGIALTDSCHQAYNTTLTGLGPLTLAWYNENNTAYNLDYNNDSTLRKYAAKNGYFIPPEGFSAVYFSFPETIESIFYAWRITGDRRWQEYNWEIFNALNTTRSADIPYWEILNVNKPYGGGAWNSLSTYFFAETLKYLYLTFTDPEVISLDRFQFNTESHPFLVQRGTCAVDRHSGHGTSGGYKQNIDDGRVEL
ncbi:maturation of Asn-linked oligosaccharides protein [Cadophora gregata]|uniref:maturation of Asn-linked oligosaccharides protein n=1 Tax=Cadophora gregata TaxID=51156 RepID=UPI0026DB7D88|nr:maturation of Asn-linked oligosaccharides protein [Cadophora gregata]KAK0118214.1 maturation of Asn-linked oligosaccharides protein [Cadophora gregata]